MEVGRVAAMRVKRVIRRITVSKQSLEEIRCENSAYFAALAAQMGELAAREAEQRYLGEIEQELEAVVEGESIEVPMVQLTQNDDDPELLPPEGGEQRA
jgi:rRNA maturation endonuclease Nob1